MAAIDSSAVATSIEWGTVAASVLGSTLLVFLLEFAMGWKRKGEIEIQVARRIAELTRLHERRLAVISETAGKLHTLRCAFRDWATGEDHPDRETVLLKVYDAIDGLRGVLEANRCFIPRDALGLLDGYRAEVEERTQGYVAWVERGRNRDLSAAAYKRASDAVDSGLELVRTSGATLERIHDEFALILGASAPTPPCPSFWQWLGLCPVFSRWRKSTRTPHTE